MNHRIFIAINLPSEIKKELNKFQRKWIELPARWVKPENLHLTLIFLGYIKDKDLLKILTAVKEVALSYNPFFINFNKICYGPPNKPLPRLVWVESERNKDLNVLKNKLEKSLEEINIPFQKEEREFIAHITLARIKTWEFRQIEPEERIEINEEINLKFEVDSIEVMESRLKKSGAQYTILESAKLKKI